MHFCALDLLDIRKMILRSASGSNYTFLMFHFVDKRLTNIGSGWSEMNSHPKWMLMWPDTRTDQSVQIFLILMRDEM